jgi:hypothetical protein
MRGYARACPPVGAVLPPRGAARGHMGGGSTPRDVRSQQSLNLGIFKIYRHNVCLCGGRKRALLARIFTLGY